MTQSGSTWGLARISHRDNGYDDYVYDSSAGQGVCAYVTDSGVDENHPVNMTFADCFKVADANS